MPHMRYDRRRLMGRGKRRMRGRGIMDFLGKANDWLRNSKIISTVAGMIPSGIGQGVSGVASILGYGRRRKMMGGYSTIGHGRTYSKIGH